MLDFLKNLKKKIQFLTIFFISFRFLRLKKFEEIEKNQKSQFLFEGRIISTLSPNFKPRDFIVPAFNSITYLALPIG